ncbi:MAG TPA: hypothetical protein VN829_17655 [Dongiaceae bacterium]|nr:hypothetical protein [Dongiaceae bacterium]
MATRELQTDLKPTTERINVMTTATETNEPANAEPANAAPAPGEANAVVAATPATPPKPTPPAGSCPTCAGGTPSAPATGPRPNSFVYALGQIEPRFPRISVEKEFRQAVAQGQTAGLTDRQVFQKVLSEPRMGYLVRQMCWVMTIAGLDTYILVPRCPCDFAPLLESLRPAPDANALDAIIGTRGPVAPADMCNGLLLPIVAFDQLFSFDRDALLKALPRPKDAKAPEFTATAAEVLDRILTVTDNAGATDDHRALNYLVMRDPAIYACVAECHGRNLEWSSVHTRPWRLSSARKIVEALFTFTQRENEFVEKYCVRVDVNDEYPFLVSKIARYYEH